MARKRKRQTMQQARARAFKRQTRGWLDMYPPALQAKLETVFYNGWEAAYSFATKRALRSGRKPAKTSRLHRDHKLVRS